VSGPAGAARASAPGEVLSLALAASSAPLSVDTLVSWDLVRPSELWALLAGAQARGELAQRAPGVFTLADPGATDAILSGATPAAWAALLATTERIAWTLEAARRARAEHRYGAANALWRGLLEAAPRDRFPGGDAGWADAALEALRYNRGMYAVGRGRFLGALEAAVALGNVAAQATLHGALALADLRAGQGERGQHHLEAARDAARAAGPAGFEGHIYVAIGLATGGRLREAIDAFEELLGDVPLDTGTLLVVPDSPSPASPVLILATAYCNAGQVPRALDLVQRLHELGATLGLVELEREADLVAAIAYLTLGEQGRARPHAERAREYVRSHGAEPFRSWVAGSVLAAVRLHDGDRDGARALLEEIWSPRTASTSLFTPVPAVLDALEQLEIEGVTVRDFDLGVLLETMTAAPNLLVRGLGHRYRARRLARSPAVDAARVGGELGRAVALLRESGAAVELARALADAEALARGGGHVEEARRLAAELRGASAQAPLTAAAAARRPPAASVLVELGRLATHPAQREGTWGELAARLCRVLAVERCALFEAGTPPRLLGARGGDAPWRDGLQALLAAAPPSAAGPLPRPDGAEAGRPGVGLVVPFAAEGRSGWACLESRLGRAVIGPEDQELLEVLSAQLGVVLGNVALWQAVSAARERLEQENRYWRAAAVAAAPGSRMVGDSPALRELLALVARVAPTTTAVLVTGETGVGKELVASEIHRQSRRRDGPFIAVHVASFSAGLVASALFGHERGAFTGAHAQTKGRFELADGGTLFLDEVGELSPEDQVRLLRVLQEGTFERVGGTRALRSDFRLVAATHRDLEADVRAGRFREDLYFRLAAFPLRVPPLRERREEIATLALFFMERASRARGVRFEGVAEADLARMMAYPWPGNVRELEHVIERAVVLSEPPLLHIPPLDAATRPATPAPATPAGPGPGPRGGPALVSLEEAERRHVAAVLRHVGGRITGAGGAAEILGLKPSTLNFRIKKLGLLDAVRQARTSTRS
jgi:transcriptional regulator with GAF, ATPase, and Fis domain/tetratricopeptide (TPR) repeat protein